MKTLKLLLFLGLLAASSSFATESMTEADWKKVTPMVWHHLKPLKGNMVLPKNGEAVLIYVETPQKEYKFMVGRYQGDGTWRAETKKDHEDLHKVHYWCKISKPRG